MSNDAMAYIAVFLSGANLGGYMSRFGPRSDGPAAVSAHEQKRIE